MDIIDLTCEHDSTLDLSNDDVILMEEPVGAGGSSSIDQSVMTLTPVSSSDRRLQRFISRLHHLHLQAQSQEFGGVSRRSRGEELQRRLQLLKLQASRQLSLSAGRQFRQLLRPVSADIDQLLMTRNSNTPLTVSSGVSSNIERSPVVLESTNASVRASAECSVTSPRQHSDGGVECAVCFDSIVTLRREKRQLLVVRCGHWFCAPCLMRSLSSAKHCPVCRAKITRNTHYHPLFI